MPADTLLGRTLDGKYRLDEKLGEGGMGTVYRATHLLIDRPVAIKVLSPRFVGDEEAQERFRREARAAGRLQHPNAVAVTDFGRTEDGFVYIVMELLQGYTLGEILAREAPLETGRALFQMLQIASAVEAAHEAGIIHRDLKPANILIAQRRNAAPILKVLDFGIAKLAIDTLEENEAKTLTQAGIMIGTPRYMSPEQCNGAKPTPASDVYSMGIILYEMLTGVTPFNGPTPLSVAVKHSSTPPPDPRDMVGTIPEPVVQLIMRTLAKAPEDRPHDASEFRRQIEDVASVLGLDLSTAAYQQGEANRSTVPGYYNSYLNDRSGQMVSTGSSSPQALEARANGNTSETALAGTGAVNSFAAEISGPAPAPRGLAAPSEKRPVFARVNVPLTGWSKSGSWRGWRKVAAVVSLAVLVSGAVLFLAHSREEPGPKASSIPATAGQVSGFPENTQSPETEATSPPGPRDNSRVEKPRDDTRDDRSQSREKRSEAPRGNTRVKAGQKHEGIVGKVTGKVKGIFKNPF